jgi:OOP family OmpA-OmpF porin
MKKLMLFSCTLFITGFIYGQGVLTYNFDSTLNETHGLGPTLSVLGTQGVFVKDTLQEVGSVTKWVYRFDVNCGLQFNNTEAGNFMGDTYSIELYFLFDELTSWKRVIDWKNRKSDNGAYVYYGQLNFYPYEYSEEAPVLPGEYTYYVVTRDGTTGEVILYTDAKNEIDFTDNNNDAVLDEDQVLNFFYDDLIVPNEASSGAVALLKLYNYVLDTATISQHFKNLSGQLFGVEDLSGNSPVKIYPNPSSGRLHIILADQANKNNLAVRMTSMMGQTVISEEIPYKQEAVLDISRLPDGLYILRLFTGPNQFCKKVLVRH